MSEPRPDDSAVSAYAAGRWPVVVRTLVLLGAPPRHAPALAAEAVSGLFRRWSEDQWLDLDAVLAAETVEAWERDRTPWWRRPELRVETDLVGTGVPEALAVLDALDPAHRTRLVVGATAGLTDDQLDDVLGPEERSQLSREWRDDLARLAMTIPVGEARVADARARTDRRRRDGRVLAVTGTGLGLLVAAGAVAVGISTIDPQPDPAAGSTSAPATGSDPTFATSTGRTGPDLVPVTWYDGSRIHLADRSLRLPRVIAMSRVGDGVIVTDDRGLVMHVLAGGTVLQLGRTAAGSVALAEASDHLAVWIERGTDRLVVAAPDGARSVIEVPAGSRLLTVDSRFVYLEQPDGPVRIRTDTLVSEPSPAGVLDASAGFVLRMMAPRTVGVDVGGDALLATRGSEGRLSDDGSYLLTRDIYSGLESTTVITLLATQERVDLPLPVGSVIVDAAFDGDDHVTFVMARSSDSQYPPDQRREDRLPTGFDLVVCDPARARCQQDAQLFATDDQPLLAR